MFIADTLYQNLEVPGGNRDSRLFVQSEKIRPKEGWDRVLALRRGDYVFRVTHASPQITTFYPPTPPIPTSPHYFNPKNWKKCSFFSAGNVKNRWHFYHFKWQ
jgi:hypothetical protein